MRVKLAFTQTSDDRFLVLAEADAAAAFRARSALASVAYDHEDSFLQLACMAELHEEDTNKVISTVLKSVAESAETPNWIEIDMDEGQLQTLGLREAKPSPRHFFNQAPTNLSVRDDPFGFAAEFNQFRDFLMQSPSPFVLLSGPEHRFAFANNAYIEKIRRAPRKSFLGKTARSTLSEADGLHFVKLLDKVYKTGMPYIGIDVLAPPYRDEAGLPEERYFDLLYQAVRNREGEIYGILVKVIDVTERVLARQVQDSREKLLYLQWAELEAIYRASPVGMMMIDAISFRITHINEVQAESIGSPVAELLGKTVSATCSDLPEFERLVSMVANGKAVSNTIIQKHSGPDGAPGRRWLVSLAPVLGISGEVNSLSAVFLEAPGDVLDGDLSRFASPLITDMLGSTSDAVFVLDRDWKFIYLNPQARDQIPNGNQMLGRKFWEEFPEAVNIGLWPVCHRTMDERVPTSLSFFYPEPINRWFDLRCFPSKLGISVFFRDITERRLKEQELEDSVDHYRSAVDLNPNVPWIMDPGGRLIDYGSQWERITGLTRAETLNGEYLKCVHPDDLSHLEAAIAHGTSTEQAFDVEWRVQRREGGYTWLRTRATPVFGPDGKVRRYCGATEDVSEVKQLRALLEQARRESGLAAEATPESLKTPAHLPEQGSSQEAVLGQAAP